MLAIVVSVHRLLERAAGLSHPLISELSVIKLSVGFVKRGRCRSFIVVVE